MAEYKRKNVKKIKTRKPKKSAVADGYRVTSFSDTDFVEDIAVRSEKEVKAQRRSQKKKAKYLSKEQPQKRVITSNKTAKELNLTGVGLRVVKGTKKLKKAKNLTTIICALIIIGCIVIVNAVSPTGIVDLIRSSVAKAGSGSGFPLTVSGGSVGNVTNTDGCITVVSDTHIEIYNSASKELVSEQHKYSNPKSITSKNRTLVFDQGANGVSVFDVCGLVSRRDMKEPIVTAAIGRNGTYCVVTDPEGVAAKVYVYDKNDKLKFKWESETDLINAVAVSDNGKYVIAATINARQGEFSSRLNVFEGKKSKPIREEQIDEVVYSVNALNNKNFLIRVGNEIMKYTATEGSLYDLTDGAVRQMYINSDGEFALYSDAGNNKGQLSFYDSYFEKQNEVEVVASPESIDWNDDYIVCSDDYSLYIFDYSGEEYDKISTNTPIEWFKISGSNILAINNIAIVSHKLPGGSNK